MFELQDIGRKEDEVRQRLALALVLKLRKKKLEKQKN